MDRERIAAARTSPSGRKNGRAVGVLLLDCRPSRHSRTCGVAARPSQVARPVAAVAAGREPRQPPPHRRARRQSPFRYEAEHCLSAGDIEKTCRRTPGRTAGQPLGVRRALLETTVPVRVEQEASTGRRPIRPATPRHSGSAPSCGELEVGGGLDDLESGGHSRQRAVRAGAPRGGRSPQEGGVRFRRIGRADPGALGWHTGRRAATVVAAAPDNRS